MAKTDLKNITAYGTAEDKTKLRELAKRDGTTDSKWIVGQIRREHDARSRSSDKIPDSMKDCET